MLEEVSLSKISRNGDKFFTEISIQNNNGYDYDPWIKVGVSDLIEYGPENGSWRLSSYLASGVVDREMDSAKVLVLPLIGLKFNQVQYSRTIVSAWIHPRLYDGNFSVPSPDYDPVKHPDTEVVTKEDCKMYIVPFYLPPFNPKLARLVAGKRVKIKFGSI